MRFSSTFRWTGGLLLLALGMCWLVASLFPDQVFSTYLEASRSFAEASRWFAAAKVTEPLPVLVPTRDDGLRSFHEDTSRKPFVVLPVSAAAEKIRGRGWEPTEAQIGGLEASLPLLAHLRAENRLAVGDVHIDHPEQYFRQYVPVVRGGNKLIFVNAFRNADATSYWRHQLVVILDGGIRNWQAFYDPAPSAFLTLRINGQ